jgi:hypothetical protein
VFFELTKEAKAARVAALGCEIFIDDLPEIFALPDFPSSARTVLFDPADLFRNTTLERRTSWAEITAELCHEHV